MTKLGLDTTTREEITLPPDTLHTYILGNTGTGKTTLERSLIAGNIEQGHGVCVIDPHGERRGCLVDCVISDIPNKRLKDVILFNVNEPRLIPGLKPFYCRDKRDEVAVQDTISTALNMFEKVYNVDRNTMARIIAYIEALIYLFIYDESLTLLDVPILLNPDIKYDKMRLRACTHLPTSPGFNFTRDFWTEEYSRRAKRGYNQDSEIFGTLMKFRELSSHLLWPMFCQKTNTLDFREIMQHKKILLVKLNGNWEDITSLIGSYLIGQIKDAAFHRSLSDPPFYLYVDEFQRMASRDFLTLFSEARGGNVHVTIDHQVSSQLDDDMKETIRQASCFVCFQITNITADSVAGMFDTTPPPGEWRYEKEMRRVTKNENCQFWDPQEIEQEYERLLIKLKTLEKQVDTYYCPIDTKTMHYIGMAAGMKKRWQDSGDEQVYQEYQECQAYAVGYETIHEFLYTEDLQWIKLAIIDKFSSPNALIYNSWQCTKLICYRATKPIPGIDPLTQEIIQHLMKQIIHLHQYTQYLQKTHFKEETREIDLGWSEPIPVMEWEYLKIARILGEEVMVGDNVKYRAIQGPPAYGSDEVARRTANQLKQLFRYQARVRLNSGEYTITTIAPSPIADTTKRVETIYQHNITAGYLRLRSEVEQEFQAQPPVHVPQLNHTPVPVIPLPAKQRKK